LKISGMDIPNTRREFEYRMNLLEEAIRKEKIHFSSQCIGGIDSLLKVKCMDNGRLDLLTVDEGARLQANMMSISFDVPDRSNTSE